MSEGKRILVLANRTAASEPLRAVLRRRAEEGAVAFHLVVPAEVHGLSRVANPEEAPRADAEQRMEAARAALEEAAGVPVTGEVGVAEPFAALQDAVNAGAYDAVVVSTLPRRISRWLHLDLPHKAAGLGLPITHVQIDGTVREIEPVRHRAPA